MIRKTITHSARRNLANALGWRDKRKIIVIESDDWGSIRMPSKLSFEKLEKSGLDLRSWDAERYNLNDTLASAHELESLFEVLSSTKDKNGRSAVFTPVSILANPDFERIKDSGFKDYIYEPFTETLKRYHGCEHSYDLWKEGIENNLFVPQLHGREHLNVSTWMKALQEKDKQALLAFEEGMWGFVPERFPEIDYQAAFLFNQIDELESYKSIITLGIQLFEQLFDFPAEYFVAPNSYINSSINEVLVKNGIKFSFASAIQTEPLGNGKSRKVVHWLGQKDKTGLRYITRNCIFEPSQEGVDWIDNCLNNIKIAFRWHKPAIISTHRVNYIGSLNPANRDRGLTQLGQLLRAILKAWPDVIFMTSSELGNYMLGSVD